MSLISDRTSALSLSTIAPVGAIGLDKNPLALTTAQPSKSVLFIDAGVTDSEQLAAGAVAGTRVYRLTAGDAVDQITQVLAGMRDVDSVQIVSHGRSGGLQLGESWLNLQTLPGYVNQLKSWSQALAAGADILLYGCNVAQGELGKAFVNLLAQATGADVAASDDLTGSVALGGDWDLEVRTGTIESSYFLSPQAYHSVLGGSDSFSTRTVLTGGVVSDTGSNVGSTGEVGEPDHAGLSSPIQSVWWAWTAPTSDTFEINTVGSPFDTTLGLYTGSTVNNLTTIASNDDSPYGLPSQVVFSATAGTQYQIAVAGFQGDTGSISLNISGTNIGVVGGSNPVENSLTNGTFTFSISNPNPNPVTFNYGLGGNATRGTDYTITAGTNITSVNANSFVLAGGATSATLTVSIINDALPETDETIQLTLTGGLGYTVRSIENIRTLTIAANDNNAAPTIALPSTTALTYTENGNALTIDSTATVADTDNTNFNTGVLTVSLAGAIASDRLSIQTANGITLDGRKVLAGGVQIGTIDTTDRGINGILKINLLAAATPALTQNLLRSIAYSNLSDALTDGTRTLSVTLTDGSGGTSTGATKTIAVTGVNDAPLIAKKTVLYNGTYNALSPIITSANGVSTATTTTQGWTSQSIYPTTVGSSAAITTANGLTTLTTNTAIYAGLARQDQILDASAGFVLSFQANVIAETLAASAQKDDDAKTDRAAFSLTLVTSDTTKAIELGFTKTTNGIRIFAQEDGTNQTNPSLEPDTAGNPDLTRQLFTQAESVDTTNPTTGYDLYIKGNTYTLFRDSIAILSGKLRNYSAAIVPLPANPYTTANFMSFGDGTASAFGQFSLGQISLLNGSLSAQTIDEDTSTTAQTFGVFDVEGNTITVSSSSSNTALVDTANVTIAGTGNNQTITVTPIANASGNTTITLTANDGSITNNTSTSGFGLTVNAINDAPTAVTFTNTTTTIAENSSTTTRTKVADITITDDALGTNTLSLTGTDAANFEISGNVLYLKSGVTLDYETKKKYDVTVNVDDTTIGNTPDAIQNFTLNVTDINEAPTVTTIANQTLLKNKTSNLINFTIADPEAANLTVTATSANSSIIANSGIAIGGSGNNRTLALTPNTNQIGTSEITISISDGTNTTTQKFTLNVTGPTSETLLRNSASGEVVVWGLNDSQITTSDYCRLSNGDIVRPDATWKIISNKSDFDNDGIRDIVWFNTASRESVIWYMSQGTSGINNIIKASTALFLPNATTSFKAGSGWQIAAVGDLMGDSLSEFLWENRVTGQTVIWQLNIAQNGRAEVNTTTSRFITLNGSAFSTGGATSGWKIIGTGNFDGDTTTKDVLWFNEISKRSVVWQLNNGAIASSGYITMNGVPVESGPFKPVAIGNLDGVGTDEIIWQSDTAVVIWDMGSNLALGNRNFLLNQPLLAGEQIQGLADIDLNGSLDLVVRRKSNGPDTTQIYYLNPTTLQLATPKPKQFITLQDPNTPFVTNDARWDVV